MQYEFFDLWYVFFRVLFIASRASQLVVQLVEVFNSSLVAAHSQLKVCVCQIFWKFQLICMVVLSSHNTADSCHCPTIWYSQVDFWDQQKLKKYNF